MEDISVTLSVLILLSSFVLIASKRIHAYIGILRLQAVLIALQTGLVGIHELQAGGRADVLVVCLIIIALKVVAIPRLLHRTYAAVEYKVEKDFFLNIPLLILICCGLVIATWFSLESVDRLKLDQDGVLLVNAIALTLIGLFFMISRRKAIGQIVGLLAIENGLFITALYASDGMPFIVDIGIFIDLITAVVVMGMIVFKINTEFESIDTDQLNQLKG